MKAEKEYSDIMIALHDRVLMFRCLEHYILSVEFKGVLLRADDADRQKVKTWTLDGNYKTVREWISNNKEKYLPIEEWSLEMLRTYASKHKIKNYGTVPKGMLIKMVKDYLHERTGK